MANRQAFKLKSLLTVWNVSLALFSIIGTARCFPELMHVLNNIGFDHSVCSSSFVEYVKPSGYWSWLFALSKLPELGDTVFIVLRKQKLIFLHWYHHITVLLFSWYCFANFISPSRWFINMNFAVHSLMYSYYALKALGYKIPTQMAMVITLTQIAQMIMGAYVVWYSYHIKSVGKPCNMSYTAYVYGLIMYISYFVLFAHFFYKSYFSSSGKRKQEPSGSGSGASQKKGAKIA